jgi:hypothetical protein
VSWFVNPPAPFVAAIDANGLLTGLSPGTAKIFTSKPGVVGQTGVTVTAAVLSSIAITPANPSIANTFSLQLTATGTFSDGSTEDLTKSVSWFVNPPPRSSRALTPMAY